MPTKDQSTRDLQALDEFDKVFTRADKGHDAFVSKCDRLHEVYRGEYKPTDDGNEWQSQLHPAEVFQQVETLYVNLIDDDLQGRVEADGPEGVAGAPIMEEVVEEYRRKDERNAKEAPWIKQGLVMPWSPGKISYRYEHGPRMRTEWTQVVPGEWKKRRVSKDVCSWDQPVFTPINARDFWVDPSASYLEEAGYAFHRIYTTMTHLRAWEKLKNPETGEPLYHNIDLVPASINPSNDRSAGTDSASHWQPDTTGKIELIEYWTRDRLITVANRRVVIRDEPHPFDHGELPFVVFTSQNDLYTIKGFSEVEHLEDLQLASWAALNQMVDGIRFVANPVVIDPNPDERDLRVFPGARIKGTPQTLQTWQPDVRFIEALTAMRTVVETYMAQTTGADPFLSGSGGGDSVDPKTATEFYGKQQAASRKLIAKRNRLSGARMRAGQQEMSLIQQLADKPVAVPIKGQKNAWQWRHPHELVGNFTYRIDDAAESLNQAQKRSEAQLLVGMITSPTFMPVLQQAGKIVDANEILEYLADAFDRPDIPNWVTDAPPPPMPPVPGGSPLPGLVAPAGGPVGPGNPVNATPLAPLPGRQGSPTPLPPPPAIAAA